MPRNLAVPALAALLSCTLVPAQGLQGTFTVVGTGCPPASGSQSAAFYQVFGGTPNLANHSIELLPSSVGYQVQTCSTGCWFTGFTASVAMGDDTTVQRTLPFTFPHPGGNTTTVGMCSNGFLWLDNVSTGASYTPTNAALMQEGARLAPMWADLDFTVGGTFYADTSATQAVFTWNQAPQYGAAGNRSTFQVQLFPSGRVVMAWQALSLSAPAVIGYSPGAATDPGPTQILTALPFSTGNGVRPVGLAQSGANPIVGTTYNMLVTGEPAGTQAVFLIAGVYQIAVDLGWLGMTGCTQYVGMDAVRFFTPAPPTSTVNMAIPNNAALVGVILGAQAAVFAPSVNPLGVAASNGGRIRVGTF
jgi:hypothetical protein